MEKRYKSEEGKVLKEQTIEDHWEQRTHALMARRGHMEGECQEEKEERPVQIWPLHSLHKYFSTTHEMPGFALS